MPREHSIEANYGYGLTFFVNLYSKNIVQLNFLLKGLGNSEMNPGKATGLNTGQSKASGAQGSSGQGNSSGKASAPPGSHVTHGDSEELNKVVILSLSRSIHMNGLDQGSVPWVKDTLAAIMQRTPHSWPTHTLDCFPPLLQEFFKDNPGPRENKANLRQKVEEEYRVWSALSPTNEQEVVQRFSNPSNTLFLCVLWKTLMDNAQNNHPYLPDPYKSTVCKVFTLKNQSLTS